MTIRSQKKLALSLLDWHGGQSSAVYAIGSCMLSDSDNGVHYRTVNHHGHVTALTRAISELRNLKKELECNALASKLEKFL